MHLLRFILIIILLILHSIVELFSILDGRVTPIYLESKYTFTNFEWARGSVYFKEGFELPLNQDF